MGIVDTHCHLDVASFDEDRELVIRRSWDAGVVAMILIGMHPESWTSTSALSSSMPGFVRAAGVHPSYVVDHWNESVPGLLTDELGESDVVAVGETGLDFHRSTNNQDQQVEAFECQLEIAAAHSLPVVIHQRNAEDEVLSVLQRYAPVSGVMHCFGGDWDFARQCLDTGLHLGIGGISTFPRSEAVRDAIERAPADRLLLETDAPYLAPQPWRGKRNEPAYLSAVVETIASVRDESCDRVREMTTANAIALFGSALDKRLVSGGRIGPSA